MRSTAAACLRGLAARIDRDDEAAQMPLAARPLFGDERLHRQRDEDAMSLLDEECCGYVLVQVRDEHGYVRFNPSFAVPDEVWPAMIVMLRRCAIAAERSY